ncbi:MAG: choice-of-anchor J domain-containing protein [Planctomycetota bacterium]|jgi:hypothetical protein|nr:choice-of-anchor J domain-containing protein [Planctomycetota bacterium]
MKNRIPLLGFALLLSASAHAQTTFLSEDFSSGLVPPPGWTELNNGNDLGWELGALTGNAAFHDDYSGWNDNHLMSPAMDLSGTVAAYAHAQQDIYFASWRDHHYVDVSVDGGLTFNMILDDFSGDGLSTLSADISAYAGVNGVNVSYHYTGDFASEWTIDDIEVNDSATPPPAPLVPWTVNLPTAFRNGGMDDFESYGGTPPADMALTNVDPLTGSVDPEAFCAIDGSSGWGANGGAACLEMGLDPFSNNYHYVRNAMVLGLSGSAAPLTIDFAGVDHGDEIDPIDGIWISEDGANWAHVLSDWYSMPYLAWGSMAGIALDDSRIDTTGNYYVMFAQEDNFPYGYLDGIGIDDLDLGAGGPPPPTLSVNSLTAGATANVSIDYATPNNVAYFVWSVAGGGPISTPFGQGMVSPPFTVIPLTTDGAGHAGMSQNVPPGTTGMSVWFHGADAGSASMLNALALTIG